MSGSIVEDDVDEEIDGEDDTSDVDSDIDIEGLESSDEIDADESCRQSDSESGKENGTKKNHHNELEKKRRRELSKSFAGLKALVKKLKPDEKVLGRDKIFDLANQLILDYIEDITSARSETLELIQSVQRVKEESTDAEMKKEAEEHLENLHKALKELSKYSHLKSHGKDSSGQEASTSSRQIDHKVQKSSNASKGRSHPYFKTKVISRK